jgi:DNA polymerase V
MGFPSPATDYVEERINLNRIFVPNPGNTFRIKTATGFMLVDRVAKVSPGDLVAFQMEGNPMLRKWYPKHLMTDDGLIEGEQREEVIVLGAVTVEVLTLDEN